MKGCEKGIDNLLNAIQAGIFTPSTKERLESLEQQKEELTIRIAQEEIIKPPIDKDKILFWLHRFRKMDTTKLEHKKRLIDSFVNAIYLYDDKIVFTFNYKDGSKTISMEEIENSALSSDLTSLGAPDRCEWLKALTFRGLTALLTAVCANPAFFHAICRLLAFIYSSATARCSLRNFSKTEQ